MYICTKAMKLNGEAYIPGDPVPESAFQPGRVGKLIACGYISESEAVPSKSEAKRVKAQTAEPAEETVQEPVEELNVEPEPVQEAEAVPEASEEKPKKKKTVKKEV